MSLDERTITRKDALLAAGAVGAVGAAAVGAAGVIGLARGEQKSSSGTVVRAARVARAPVVDPSASVWEATPETVLPLLAQRVAPPVLDTLGVAEIRVRALHDGRRLAIRVRWEDATVDDLDGVGRYHDAVAMMLPTSSGAAPAITMGAVGSPVQIVQWRATWERDLAGKTGVDQIYPRVVHDVMPDDVLPERSAALYWVGRAAGNPLSQVERTSPVEQVVAEGFGTTTHASRQDVVGRGINDGSTWTVVLGCPLERAGIGEALTPGSTWPVAFAVWLGDQSNRGGRKHYVDWAQLSLEATS